MAKATKNKKEEVTIPAMSGVVTLIGNGTCHLKKGKEYTVTASQAEILIKKGAGELKTEKE